MSERFFEVSASDTRPLPSSGVSPKSTPNPMPSLPLSLMFERESPDSRDWRRVARQIHQHVASLHAGISVELVDPSMEKLPPLLSRAGDPSQIRGMACHERANPARMLHLGPDITGPLEVRALTESGGQPDNYPCLRPVRLGQRIPYHTERKRIEAICAQYEARDVSILFLKDELKLQFPYTERAKLRNATYFQGRTFLESGVKLYKSGRSTQ
ncbi:hypothetical protein BP00DRAFT_459974 [Aspergillus indologenus CBS 114.80]|uniref:Uncharacterized protein n=1 Tax=Aspergillus indologenus CBS 114.80 TaxID=1450541 RepID=A0A2V5IGX0_9EURO|nr:hypothetical protein BP00DRAFT_459974 [Aspergillus indologenus CBS 114.80]